MRNAFKFLIQHCLTTPTEVDRLIVSAFLEINQLQPQLNKFLQTYFIEKRNKEEYAKLIEFISVINLDIDHFGFEELIELFEFVISPADRIINGAIYTPENIRKYIIKETLGTQTEITEFFTISDISCGCGGFLFDASIELRKKTNKLYSDIFRNHIFGLDIQEYSITRTKLLLSLLALSEGENVESFSFNLFIGDALSFNWKSQTPGFDGFDIIIGNPPYVCSRNISEDSKKLLDNWEVCKSGHPDLYIPFFQIGIENLTSNGILGYITMNTFFKSVNGRALREYFQNEKFDFKILDFGNQQIFQSRSTYTCVCLIHKTGSEFLRYFRLSTLELLLENDFSYNSISYSTLNAFNGWNLQEIDAINRIEAVGTPLGNIFKSRNGIATLKNSVYIFDALEADNDVYYLNNGTDYQIEKQICKDIINPNMLTKLDSIDQIIKKIIFPYIFEDGHVKLIPELEFKKCYPKAYNYLFANKELLAKRDKGNGNYENWYAYGRNQSLERLKYKLFFPHIAPSTPNFVLNSDENILFHNGLAIIGENEKELQFLRKLMSTRLFWFYIEKSSKPYGSGYFSLSRNYIKNFGIFDFTDREIDSIIAEENPEILNEFIESKYGITFDTTS